MKKRSLLLILTTTAAVILAGVLIFTNNTNSERAKYENFLTQEYKDFPWGENSADDKEPALDRPDIAAFSDYIKTMDPELKAVPTWRLQNGLERSKALQANDVLKSGSTDIKWTHHPTDMGGRTRAMMFDPNDSSNNKVWAGSVTGGLWVNDSPFLNGSWRPIDNFWANLSISCMTYDPNNTNTFYVGTGESQTALIIYRESSARGAGIFRSLDAGETWEVIPSTKDWAYVTDVLVRDESGQSVIYAGVISGRYKGKWHQSSPTDGLYRSTDSGETWSQVLPNIEGEDVPYPPSDIEVSSDNKRIFIGTTYNVDGKGASCILHSDDGLNWAVKTEYQQQILDGRTISSSSRTWSTPGRVVFSNAPANPDIMFALIAGGYEKADDGFTWYDCVFLLKSTDKGETWTNMNIPMRDGQNTFAYLAWHALVVEVSPINPNLVWIGGLDTWRSFDGGNNWTKLSRWNLMGGRDSPQYVHADIHDFKFKPGSDTDMLIITDGGIFGTKTASASSPAFFEVNKAYSTLQYYSGAIHPDAGAEHFIGGLQDNGTQFYKPGNIPTHKDMLSGGDGALCFIDKNEPNRHITTVYNSSIYLYSGGIDEDPGYYGGRSFDQGTFINPMDYNWKDNILFANGRNEKGVDPNTLLVIGIGQNNPTGTLHGVPTHCNVPYSVIKYSEHSLSNNSTIFIGTQAGQLFKLEDASRIGDLTELTSPDFPTANISSIDIGQSEDTLLVTFSNYGVASVWLTVDGGQNWMNKEGDLPDMPVRWALFHPENNNQVMLATELGTWTTTKIQNESVVWSPRVDGMANVRVDQIKLRESDNTILAATHGRGMYTGIWNADYTSGINSHELSKEIKVYPNPTVGEFNIEIELDGKTEVSISDLAGRMIYQNKFIATTGMIKSIDIENEPDGIYLVRITSGNKQTTKKIIKR